MICLLEIQEDDGLIKNFTGQFYLINQDNNIFLQSNTTEIKNAIHE